MLFNFLAMIPQPPTGAPAEPPVPTLSNPVLTHFAGVCSNHNLTTSARVTLSWSETNFNSTLHEHRIYQDNVLLATIGSGTSYQKQVSGVVEDGCGASWQSNWVFRVDTVRKSDSIVLASVTYSPHVWYYGSCC